MSNDSFKVGQRQPSAKSIESFLDVAMGLYGKGAKDKWADRKAERKVSVDTPLAIIRATDKSIALEEAATQVETAAEIRLAELLDERLSAVSFFDEGSFEQDPIDRSPLWDALDGSDKKPWLNEPDFIEKDYNNYNIKNNLDGLLLKENFNKNTFVDDQWRPDEEQRQRQAELDAMMARREEEQRQRQAEIDAMMARREEERRQRQREIDAMIERREEEKRYLYNDIKKPDYRDELRVSKAFNAAALDLDIPNVATPADAIRMMRGRSKRQRGFG